METSRWQERVNTDTWVQNANVRKLTNSGNTTDDERKSRREKNGHQKSEEEILDFDGGV